MQIEVVSVFWFSFQWPWWIYDLSSKVIRRKTSSTEIHTHKKIQFNFSLQLNPLVILFLCLQFWFREIYEVSVEHSVAKLLHFDYSRCRCESVTWIVIWLQKLLCLLACTTAQGCLCIFGCPQGHWFCLLLSSSLNCTKSHDLHPHDRT